MNTRGGGQLGRASGRYRHEPPVGFACDIIDSARSKNLSHGVYIGCGHGQNFRHMSPAAISTPPDGRPRVTAGARTAIRTGAPRITTPTMAGSLSWVALPGLG
jgi:hypothetical protein